MRCNHMLARALEGGLNLQEAPWIGGGQDARTRLGDVRGLTVTQRSRRLRLQNVIDARAATTDLGLCQLYDLDPRN